MAIVLGQFREQEHERMHLAWEQLFHDLAFALVKNLDESLGRTSECTIDVFEFVETLAIDEHSIREIHEIVTSRPVRTPIACELLVACQDLLDEDVRLR